MIEKIERELASESVSDDKEGANWLNEIGP